MKNHLSCALTNNPFGPLPDLRFRLAFSLSYFSFLISKNALRNIGAKFKNSLADKPVKLFINRSDFNALSISMTIFLPFLRVRSSYHFSFGSLTFIRIF